MRKTGLPAISNADTKILILGTFPGEMSLMSGSYYGHPRNQFWIIMGELIGAVPALPYRERVEILLNHRIGLWNVCASVERKGSSDSAIRNVTPNNFEDFFREHKKITHIIFNGRNAEKFFLKHVLKKIDVPPLQLFTLPDTSPANAQKRLQQKITEWRVILNF